MDRNSLEDVMRRALEEVEHAGEAPDRRDRRGIEDVMQSALRERDTGQGRPRQAAAVSGGRPPAQVAPRSRRALAKATMAAILLVAGIAAVWSAIRSEREAHTAVTASAARAGATPLSEGDRGIVGQSLATLRELQSAGRPEVPARVYLNRVSFAQAELDRAIAGLTDSALRARVKEVLALHVLAATAWRAKTVNERPQWEAAGQDPAVNLCPTVERILNSDEPRAMSRAEWRGVALAATVPLLWDCAADHLAAIEKDVRDR